MQVTYYYPWGSVYGDMGTGASVQPYKYGDKELDLTAGVARYDYAARAYFIAIPRFDRPDALAGKYPHISPYAFCANNPVNALDSDGKLVIFINGFVFFDGGSANYWEGKDRMIMDILEDHNAMYFDGSPSGWWRFKWGKTTFTYEEIQKAIRLIRKEFQKSL
ncbi:MAG: hypothetical protein K2K25_08655 [Muribaculaceae bacterium]|nr:hypothetical protein [Muribaculaceae bacterium]